MAPLDPTTPGGFRRRSRARRAAPALAAAGLLMALAGCASHRPAVRGPELPREPAVELELPREGPEPFAGGVHHRVQPGQTLWRIATVYGVPLEELARVNGIQDPATLESGALIFVPGAVRTLEVPPYPAPLTPAEDVAGVVSGAELSLALVWPVAGGELVSGFGAPRPGRRHKGIDIAGRPGQPVVAAAAGKVVYSGATMRGYGKTVIVDHGNGLRSLYAHGSKLLVKPGDRVERGQPIALVGRTGNATTEHCHFEIRRGGVPLDPLPHFEHSAAARR